MGGDEMNIKSLQASHIKILTQRIYMKVYVLGFLSTQLYGRSLCVKDATLEYPFSWSFSHTISIKIMV
jgi:hypothetical protein